MTESTEQRDHIRIALERAVKAMELRDSVGKGTAKASVRLDAGLACRAEEGEWSYTTDMSAQMGGTGSGPTPGVLGRAAIGTCFATSFAMWAARKGIPFDNIVVELEADFDARGEFGVDDSVPPSYLKIRLNVRVASPAPPEEIEELLALTEAHTSWLDMMRRPIAASTTYEIVGGS